jgi:hypothetical protein
MGDELSVLFCRKGLDPKVKQLFYGILESMGVTQEIAKGGRRKKGSTSNPEENVVVHLTIFRDQCSFLSNEKGKEARPDLVFALAAFDMAIELIKRVSVSGSSVGMLDLFILADLKSDYCKATSRSFPCFIHELRENRMVFPIFNAPGDKGLGRYLFHDDRIGFWKKCQRYADRLAAGKAG